MDDLKEFMYFIFMEIGLRICVSLCLAGIGAVFGLWILTVLSGGTSSGYFSMLAGFVRRFFS